MHASSFKACLYNSHHELLLRLGQMLRHELLLLFNFSILILLLSMLLLHLLTVLLLLLVMMLLMLLVMITANVSLNILS